MTLADTLELMKSDSYKDRFKAEYYQLKIRYTRLEQILQKWDSLNFAPCCPKAILEMQLDAMRRYMDVLKARADIEDIEIG